VPQWRSLAKLSSNLVLATIFIAKERKMLRRMKRHSFIPSRDFFSRMRPDARPTDRPDELHRPLSLVLNALVIPWPHD
jgi:hypothetical protein